jgi:hypothetical protein
MEKLGRREVLRASGAATLAVAIPASALASGGSDDAELVSLWERWQEQRKLYFDAVDIHSAAETAAFAEIPSHWQWTGDIGSLEECPFCASFTAYNCGALISQNVPLPRAKTIEQARKMAHAKNIESEAEYKRAKRAGQRRYKVRVTEKASNLEYARLGEIGYLIIEAEAEGLRGVAIKLALLLSEADAFMQEPADEMAQAAYDAVAKLAAFDPAAQIA